MCPAVSLAGRVFGFKLMEMEMLGRNVKIGIISSIAAFDHHWALASALHSRWPPWGVCTSSRRKHHWLAGIYPKWAWEVTIKDPSSLPFLTATSKHTTSPRRRPGPPVFEHALRSRLQSAAI